MPPETIGVSALPVVVPLAVLALAALLVRLHRRGALTPPRALVAAALCVYGAGVVANTLFPVIIGRGDRDLPWTVFLNLVPLANTDAIDMLQNIVVFVPLGVLLPLVLRSCSVGRVVLTGFLLSLAMESLQLLNAVTARGGHVADVNDLLANTLGAPIGHAAFRIALLVPALALGARAAAWPGASGSRQGRRKPADATS